MLLGGTMAAAPGEAEKPPPPPPPETVWGKITGNLIGSESGGEQVDAAESGLGVVGPESGEFRPMGDVSGESLAVPPSWSEL